MLGFEQGGRLRKRNPLEIEIAEFSRQGASYAENGSYVSPISLLDEYNHPIQVRNDKGLAQQIHNHAFRELAPLKSLK